MSQFVTLAAAQIESLVGHAAETGRLSRGRALFRKGAVLDLAVADRTIYASVRGSGGDEYDTSVATAPAPPGVIREVARNHDPADRRSLDRLIDDGVKVFPRVIDLAFSCSCPDWEEPCKHAVAVLFAFADRVDLDEHELLRWRGIDQSASPEPPSRQTKRSDRSPDGGSGDDKADLRALLGDTAMRLPRQGEEDVTDDLAAAAPLDPAIAEFLGVGLTVEPIELDDLEAPPPLFGGPLVGPLAGLGQELTRAVAIIRGRLG